MLHNKKAVVGETLTWIVATLIIVVILVFSIYATSLLSIKNFVGGGKELSSIKEKDLLATKSLTGYLLTEDDGETVFEQLKEERTSNNFNENLALKIFRGLHSRDYFITLKLSGKVVTRVVPNNPYSNLPTSFFDERIYLAEDLDLAVYFNHVQDEN